MCVQVGPAGKRSVVLHLCCTVIQTGASLRQERKDEGVLVNPCRTTACNAWVHDTRTEDVHARWARRPSTHASAGPSTLTNIRVHSTCMYMSPRCAAGHLTISSGDTQ